MRKNILTLAAALVCTAAMAQNINPTVEVTNTYQGDPSEVHKPQIGMAIPDSLLRFDMDFGYEVFEKPYQGAYNFKPYMLDMTPEKNAYRGRKLYLKAGAGYSLHPQLDFVFSPERSGPFQMSVYAGHRSYFGNYNRLQYDSGEQGILDVIKIPGKSFRGYDALSSAGFEGKYNFSKAVLSFGLGYDGLLARDTLFRRSYNAGTFNLRLRANRDDSRYVFYDFAIDGRIGADSRSLVAKSMRNEFFMANAASAPVWDNINESAFKLTGAVGPVFDATHAALLGLEAETVSYGGLYESNAGRLAVIPRYRFTSGKFGLDLGVKVEAILKGKADETAWHAPLHQYKGGLVFPDVRARFSVNDNVSLYASATGGHSLNTYSSVLSRHHFIIPENTRSAMMDNSVEKINAKIGVKGNVGAKFQFDVDAGAAVVGNGLLDAALWPVYITPSDGSDHISYGYYTIFSSHSVPYATILAWPSVVYSDYSLIYADALFDLTAGNFRVDGGLHFKHMALKDDTNPGLLLPKLSCDLKAVYDFSSRVYAGITLEAAGQRKGRTAIGLVNPNGFDEIRLPGWVDLGLVGGWRFNRKLGFWLESGNLLCETIQRTPLYSEKDLWITAGITLSL